MPLPARADASPLARTFVRFRVSAESAIAHATLRLYVPRDGTVDAPTVHQTRPNWTEFRITWKNQPVITRSALDDRATARPGTWIEYDVTRAVTGPGAFSFVVLPESRDSVTMNSRQAGSKRPRVVVSRPPATAQPTDTPPPRGGYFRLVPAGAWESLRSGESCKTAVHRSTWEPRPDNDKRNHTVPDPGAVRSAFRARPRAVDKTYNSKWDTWLLPRVDGQFTGTTDEIFQWAACKWGLSDDMLRAIAVRESTWYQYLTYPSGRCVTNWGCGDIVSTPTAATATYCNAIARYGYGYQKDFGSAICPKTFSIAGVMAWQDPFWGSMHDNQNGTFPFSRNSTAFAVDYLAAYLRGCYEGWEYWLPNTGTQTYSSGDIGGCVGSWYSGDWHTSRADGYISRVQNELTNFTWLQPEWPMIKRSCSPEHGCPGPDPGPDDRSPAERSGAGLSAEHLAVTLLPDPVRRVVDPVGILTMDASP